MFGPFFCLGSLRGLGTILGKALSGEPCSRLLVGPYAFSRRALGRTIRGEGFSLLNRRLSTPYSGTCRVLTRANSTELDSTILSETFVRLVLGASRGSSDRFVSRCFGTAMFCGGMGATVENTGTSYSGSFLRVTVYSIRSFPHSEIVRTDMGKLRPALSILSGVSTCNYGGTIRRCGTSPSTFRGFISGELVDLTGRGYGEDNSNTSPVANCLVTDRARGGIVRVVTDKVHAGAGCRAMGRELHRICNWGCYHCQQRQGRGKLYNGQRKRLSI